MRFPFNFMSLTGAALGAFLLAFTWLHPIADPFSQASARLAAAILLAWGLYHIVRHWHRPDSRA